MVIAPFIAAATVMLGQGQARGSYEKLFPRPDLNNGYADYVRAADAVHGPEISICFEWSPDQFAKLTEVKRVAASHPSPDSQWTAADEEKLSIAQRLSDLDFLGVQRYIVRRFAGALAEVRAGNKKNVWDPREKIEIETTFPELADFRKISKLFRADAFVKFADGDSHGGTADLLDSLTFATKIGGGNLLGELVAGSCKSISLAAFDDHLSRLSENDAATIAKYMDAALAQPSTFLQAVQREKAGLLSSLDELFSSPTVLAANPSNVTPEETTLINYLKNMSPSDRDTLKGIVSRDISHTYDAMIDQIGQGEASWLDKTFADARPAPSAIGNVNDAADAVLAALYPSHDQATLAVLRLRTQLRLLDLHSRIIQFRWHTNRLPSSLKEVAPDALVYDPMAKESFHYERGGNTYRLYAKGVASTGPIELQYQRPAKLAGSDPIPPAR